MNAYSVRDTTNDLQKKRLITTKYSDSVSLILYGLAFHILKVSLTDLMNLDLK